MGLKLFYSLIFIGVQIISHSVSAGTIGSFQNIQNEPGHITADRGDDHYKGSVALAELTRKDGIDRRSPSQVILQTYVNSDDGRVNVASLQRLFYKSKSDKEAAFKLTCQKEKSVAGAEFCARSIESFKRDSSAEAQALVNDFLSSDIVKARDFADAEAQRALDLSKNLPPLKGEAGLNSAQAYEFYEALFNAIDVYTSLQFEDPIFGNLYKTIKLAKTVIADVMVTGNVEASNLVDPATGAYVTASTLKNRTTADVSELNPRDSGFWRKPKKDIASYNTNNYDGAVTVEDPRMLDPQQSVDVDFHKAKGKGASPKIDVRIEGVTYKLKYFVEGPRPADAGNLTEAVKAYTSSYGETQTETVVNNLAAALGFTVDPTFYKDNVRLFLTDEYSREDMDNPGKREAYATRFGTAHEKAIQQIEEHGTLLGNNLTTFKWNFRKALSEVSTVDEGPQKGRMYVNLKNVSLERRPDDENEIEVGGFNKITNGRSLKREFRGFQLFYAWINDRDAKDLNAELKLIKVKKTDGSDTYKVVFSASDMGSSLGWMFSKGTPNTFPKDLVDFAKTDTEKGVLALKLNMYAAYDIWNSVTMSDARWMARLIGQLSADQIRQALRAGHYPEYVVEVFTQKLLRRRDQLLTATGLMGTTARSDGTGQPLTFQPESQIKDGVVYKVAGFEDCFDEKGNLIAVANKCDEKWTDSLLPIKDGSREREALNALLYGQAPKLAEPFVRKLQRFDLMRGLTQGGFFEGVSVGVDSFIPARYIIENPLKNSTREGELKPWWIVDVFRTGYGILRHKNLDAQFHRAGFELTPEDTSFNTKISKTWELVRIRAVRDPKEFADGILKIYAPQNEFVTAMKNLSEKMVETMQAGDVLISSTYLTPGFTMSFNPLVTATTLISPQIKIGASHAVTNRITIVRTADSKALVNWEDLSKSDLGGNLSLKVFMFNLGGLKQRLTKLSASDRLYNFDLNSGDQKALLMKSLKRSLPQPKESRDQNLMASLAVSDKNVKQKESIRSFDFLGLPTFLDYKRSQEVVVRDPKTHAIEDSFLSYKKAKNSRGIMFFSANILNSNEVSSEAVADKNGSLFARFKIDYSRSWAKRAHFEDLTEKLLPLLPGSFVQFTPKDVNYYLGTLELDGEVLYSNEAIQDILSRNLSKDQACSIFVKSLGKSVPEVPNLCEVSMNNIDVFRLADQLGRTAEDKSRIRSALMATRSFTENFMSAQKAYIQRGVTTLTSDGKSKVQKAMRKVVTLLETRPLRNYVLLTLQNLTTEDKVYRSARLSSSMGGLPNQEEEVRLNSLDGGAHVLTDLEKSNSIVSYTDTQIDAVHDAVRSYFFDFLYRNSVLLPPAIGTGVLKN